MFALLLIMFLGVGEAELTLPPGREEHLSDLDLLTSDQGGENLDDLDFLTSEQGVGLGKDYIHLTIQSYKGYRSWQGALMVSIGPSYNKSNDRNVCQRFNKTDYKISDRTAHNICKLNSFHRVDSVRPLDYYATWWAIKINSSLTNLTCSSSSCTYTRFTDGDRCDGYDDRFAYYTTLSCSCDPGYYKTRTGCHSCPSGATCRGNSTTWSCRAGYEPDGGKCKLCWSSEFTDGRKYKYCTYCPSGARTTFGGCKCDPDTNNQGDRVWDYDTNTCRECPEDTFRDKETNNCTACPIGTNTFGTGRVRLADCRSCSPSNLSLFGKCVNKVLFYLALSGGLVLFLSCCCCYCCCCRKTREPTTPPITIRHNVAAARADVAEPLPAPSTAPATVRNLEPTPARTGVRPTPAEPSAPPPSFLQTPAYNPSFQSQVPPPWQHPQFNEHDNIPGPQINVHDNIPGPQFNVHDNIPSPQFNVHDNITGPQLNVNVNIPGPQFNVHNNIPGPQLNVNVNIPGPPVQHPHIPGSPGQLSHHPYVAAPVLPQDGQGPMNCAPNPVGGAPPSYDEIMAQNCS